MAFQVHSAWQPAKSRSLLAYQRAPWAPPVLPKSPRLGQVGSITPGALLPTAFSAGASYVGFKLASQEDGFVMLLGYLVGALGALSALVGVATIAGVVKPPSFLKI